MASVHFSFELLMCDIYIGLMLLSYNCIVFSIFLFAWTLYVVLQIDCCNILSYAYFLQSLVKWWYIAPSVLNFLTVNVYQGRPKALPASQNVTNSLGGQQ